MSFRRNIIGSLRMLAFIFLLENLYVEIESRGYLVFEPFLRLRVGETVR